MWSHNKGKQNLFLLMSCSTGPAHWKYLNKRKSITKERTHSRNAYHNKLNIKHNSSFLIFLKTLDNPHLPEDIRHLLTLHFCTSMGSKLSLCNLKHPLVFPKLEQLTYTLLIRCKPSNLSNEIPHKVHPLTCGRWKGWTNSIWKVWLVGVGADECWSERDEQIRSDEEDERDEQIQSGVLPNFDA